MFGEDQILCKIFEKEQDERDSLLKAFNVLSPEADIFLMDNDRGLQRVLMTSNLIASIAIPYYKHISSDEFSKTSAWFLKVHDTYFWHLIGASIIIGVLFHLANTNTVLSDFMYSEGIIDTKGAGHYEEPVFKVDMRIN